MTAIALLLSWLFTGGCTEFEAKYRYVESYNKNYRPYVSVKVISNYRTSGIPFLFTCHYEPPPYDGEFYYYTQDIVEGAELTIERIAIRYSDGTEVELTDQVDKTRILEPYEMWYIEDHVLVKKPSLRTTWTIHNCITRKDSFTFLMTGKLRKEDRLLETFDTSLSCRPFGDTRLYPTWYFWFVSRYGA